MIRRAMLALLLPLALGGACGGGETDEGTRDALPPASETDGSSTASDDQGDAGDGETTSGGAVTAGAGASVPLPDGLSYGEPPENVTNALRDLLESEEGRRTLTSARMQVIQRGPDVVGNLFVYELLPAANPSAIVNGYLDSTGGGERSSASVNGHEVVRVTRPPNQGGLLRHVLISPGEDVVLILSAATEEDLLAVAGALLPAG